MDIKEYIEIIEHSIDEIEELKKNNRDSYQFSRWKSVIQNLFEHFPLIHNKLEDNFTNVSYSPGAYFLDDTTSHTIQLSFIDGLMEAKKILRMIFSEVKNYNIKAFKYPERFDLNSNTSTEQLKSTKKYDAFLAHANEDKESIANELYKELTKSGLNIWYDDFCINLGDSIREKIDEGLLNSNHGLLLLSKNFFKKSWCKKELNALFSLNINNIIKKIIPIWFQVIHSEVEKYSPIMADIKAVSIEDKKIKEAIESITKVIKAESENKKMLEINNSNSEKEINSSKDKTLDINLKIIKQESYYDRVKKAHCDSIGITFLIDDKPGFYLDVFVTRTQAAVYEGHTNKDSFEYLIEKGKKILDNKISRNIYKSQVIDLSPVIRKQFNS